MTTRREIGPAASAIAGVAVLMGLLGSALPAAAQAVPGYCNAPHKIDWPASSPVWSLCWYAPGETDLVEGAGLELRHVFYKGKRVFWHATLPVLNVLYDPGGCGGSSLSYRDWQTQIAPFEANNVLAPNYAEPSQPPVTVCAHPGHDAGSFAGVAAEKRSDRLILTTQMQAGWYRYIQTWTFHLDGTIEPRLGFTVVDHSCAARPHSHHAYWRFDFDIDGPSDDRFRERAKLLFFSWWRSRPVETDRVRRHGRRWRVLDASGRGYEIRPRPQDGVADTWADADVWLLRYHGNELDDGGATFGPMGDAIHLAPYLNGESVDRRDVVLWYRVGHRHEGVPSCGAMEGPTLKPLGSW